MVVVLFLHSYTLYGVGERGRKERRRRRRRRKETEEGERKPASLPPSM